MNVPLLPRSPRKASESRARTGAPAEEYRVMVFDNFDTDVKDVAQHSAFYYA